MRESWPNVPLRQVLKQVERPEPVDPERTYRLLGARWYADGLFIKETCPGSSIQAARVYKVQEGDFVYNRLFAWKGSFALAGPDHDGCYVSNEFPCFLADPDHLDTRCLRHYFSREISWLEALGLSSGGTPTSRNRLKEEPFLRMTLPLPPLPEQRRIVARIEELAGKIAEANHLQGEVDDNLSHFVSSLHCKLSGDREIVVSDFLDLHEEQEEIVVDISYPQIGVRGFGGGLFKKYAVKGNETTYRYFNRVFSGALILSQVKGWEGAIGVASDDLAGWYVSPEYRTFRYNPDEADPNYLRYIVATSWFWSKLKTLTRGVGARRERTRPDQFLKMRLPMPTVDRQWEVLPLLNKLDALDGIRAAAELDALLPSILDKAFRGEL
jgi:type I restriction enzyme S subunit